MNLKLEMKCEHRRRFLFVSFQFHLLQTSAHRAPLQHSHDMVKTFNKVWNFKLFTRNFFLTMFMKRVGSGEETRNFFPEHVNYDVKMIFWINSLGNSCRVTKFSVTLSASQPTWPYLSSSWHVESWKLTLRGRVSNLFQHFVIFRSNKWNIKH